MAFSPTGFNELEVICNQLGPGIILGSTGGHFKLIWGSFWGHPGVMLESSRVILESCWGSPGNQKKTTFFSKTRESLGDHLKVTWGLKIAKRNQNQKRNVENERVCLPPAGERSLPNPPSTRGRVRPAKVKHNEIKKLSRRAGRECYF